MKKIIKYSIVMIFAASLVNVAFSSTQWTEVASEDNIKVYSHKSENGLLPFKAKGIVNANVEKVLSILKNYKLKHQWSPKLKSVKVHQKLSDSEFIFSEYYKTPWPAFDREFLLKGGIKKISDSQYLLEASSVDNDLFKDKKHIQANVKTISVLINMISINKTSIEFEFHGNMKGWMPIWLMNIIQKKWPLRFIQGLRKHASSRHELANL